jgi:glycosyltransferase involved in cell wall biosynthesis
MSKSLISILTYNRVHALREMVSGLVKHCAQYEIHIVDDCGNRDGTEAYLKGPSPTLLASRPDLLAEEWDGTHLGPNIRVFLGTVNLGVAGNSNRCLKLYDESGCDHLCLCNDDIHVNGDFVNFYLKGHEDLGVGMFLLNDFTHHESYRWITVNSRGYRIKLSPRLTGIMMSITRNVFDAVGYFDVRFRLFGNEHCDYTYRARFAGFVSLDGQPQAGIDLEFPKGQPPLIKHQDVETSVTGAERVTADLESVEVMRYIASRYGYEPLRRPFCLRIPKTVGGHGGLGIPVNHLGHYALVDAQA